MTSKYKNIIHISNVNHSVTGFDSCVQVNRSHPWETLRWTATSRLNSADSRPCLLGDAASTNTGAEKTSPSGSGSPLAHHTVHNAHNVLLLWKSRGRTDGDGWQFAQLCHLQHELEDLPVVSFYQSACFFLLFSSCGSLNSYRVCEICLPQMVFVWTTSTFLPGWSHPRTTVIQLYSVIK